jgi:hypothetical protein|tara:strand:- start:100 stop:606 length:507 start_codon:yes stop_codon:yes gene_type:complete
MSDDLGFLDELQGESVDKDNIVDIHVDQILWMIGKLEGEIADIQQKQVESKEFYDRRIDAIQNQINYRSALLESFMQGQFRNNDKKTSKMPNGTLKLTTRLSRKFGDDDTLIKYSYDNDLPTRVSEKPDKKAIIEHIKNTGDVPDGYEEEEETSFSFKTNTNNNQQQQ